MSIVTRIAATLLGLFLLDGTASAATPLKVVASFSILGDIVAHIGGDKVQVVTLVGPDGDAHVYEPTPADAKTVGNADLVVVNGLGFEGWLDRLIKASGYKGKIIVASNGVKPRTMAEEDEHEHGHDHGHAHGDSDIDPHAWQNIDNGKLYAKNIARALIEADPVNEAAYRQAETAYLAELTALATWAGEQFAAIPDRQRRMITSHDAFGYLGDAYGIQILSPVGVSTASEPSAGDVKQLIRQINKEHITAVFVENISDRRLIEQIARESKVAVGGALYSDALSAQDGPAPTYIDMFRGNVEKIAGAMRQGR